MQMHRYTSYGKKRKKSPAKDRYDSITTRGGNASRNTKRENQPTTSHSEEHDGGQNNRPV